MLLFDQKTGRPICALLDEGYLTDLRTAAAGAIAAKSLAPKHISCIGIVGTGAQAYFQLKLIGFATSCRRAMIWGRDMEKARKLATHPEFREWTMTVVQSLDELMAECNLVVTTTASAHPLLFAHQLRPGMHITAIGADDVDKQELEAQIFAKADRVIVDSRHQCASLGDVSYVLKQGLIGDEKLVELGEVLINPALGRTDDNQITVCDLTGIVIQDLQIAASIYEILESALNI